MRRNRRPPFLRGLEGLATPNKTPGVQNGPLTAKDGVILGRVDPQTPKGRFWRFGGPESELQHHQYAYIIGYQAANQAGRGIECADPMG